MNFIQRGHGRPLLLIHGLGGSWRSWSRVLNALAAQREVIAIDLPGFGGTPPLPGEVSVPTLADAVTRFIDAQGLRGVDAVGSSMGARLVLELARRNVTGATVSLDPGGFWHGWERAYFHSTVWLSIRVVRALQPLMPAITRSAVGRTMLLLQFSARPWALPADVVLAEMRDYAAAASYDALLHSLVFGPEQQGAPARSTPPITIGWGTRDHVCLPRQAVRALQKFPGARLHWFERCGHFPQWDAPQQAVQLILRSTGVHAAETLAAAQPSRRPLIDVGLQQSVL